ncbi:hypothetical protein C3941_19585 [Kaistia algarum]|uniref:DUF5419 family protein n=1 Tax=Kaistia algarum TaxID=2083279 RepID=UPI000CE7AD16|nr:hypothetical protein [Kaistia algarum]MCX5516195.1 hypothetical protein [Kaistia algarum]PPE78269.1 hypothetical protein C3941_19585 [Kaistia algarum]
MDILAQDLVDFEAGPLAFEEWLKLIDAEVQKLTAFGRDDFRDWEYADAYEAGVEPRDAAIAMLSEDHIGREFLALSGIEPEDA